MNGSGRHVVVTGTSGGLGLRIAQDLSAAGYAVTGIARREPQTAPRGDYHHVRADLADLDALPALARDLVAERGVPYGLVNNAARGADGLLPMTPDSTVRDVLELNLTSPVLLTKHLVRPMIAAGVGRVVMVTSIVASTGFRGLAVYGAAKSGLEGFARSLARDVGRRGVTVNSVAPGFLETEMTSGISDRNFDRIRGRAALGRAAGLGEVAAAVGYLLSPEAAGVTGTVLTVDAGGTA